MHTVAGCLLWAQQTLASADAAEAVLKRSAPVDSRWLLCHVLQRNSAWLKAWPEAEVSAQRWQQYQRLVERRKQGEPVAYLTGEQGFWSLELEVSAATLVPRADTELLVETALQLSTEDSIDVLDLGTGTGAVALALKSERPGWRITATDVDDATVQLARRNSERCQLPIHIIQSDWFANIPPHQFHVIVSNPPYIETDDPHLQGVGVRFEPLRALVSGKDGLDAIREIVRKAGDYLRYDGWLLIEHGFQQGEAVREIYARNGFASVATLRDLADNERLTMGCWKKDLKHVE
ncbi:peptide chain release factor N(5)-glutamine methyltransferase [Ketobacter sp. MCCC 1A13808]|uniref:peptide chain release factor N(5)-glutamine methyltransferase n=1 Tax=Ketobacter sp. MCCC 1A13808 TaxID=2602738 RepID=UPI0012EBE91E|nr:peptide chain release factor N(5)-glutamine methyltransferase [Ketobacter sp. MCCC 1A13808]MVF11275.1 peptide chain release factor N(5)-glutamine methyltransferase [Ketobacter sp. MCCC 1A13808]